MYHGMAQGLARMANVPAMPAPTSATTADPQPTVASEPALIHQLANMVLRIQSEVQHVY
jgi:hypothetical protein